MADPVSHPVSTAYAARVAQGLLADDPAQRDVLPVLRLVERFDRLTEQPACRDYIARATARGVGRRQAVCSCEIFSIDDRGERLCALAQGTVVAVAG